MEKNNSNENTEKKGGNNLEDGEKFLEDLINQSSDYMIKKLDSYLNKAKEQRKKIRESERADKEKIEKKIEEKIDLLKKIISNMKKQAQLQRESIDLQQKFTKIDEELDSLLI